MIISNNVRSDSVSTLGVLFKINIYYYLNQKQKGGNFHAPIESKLLYYTQM